MNRQPGFAHIHSISSGEGPPVILIHGIAASSSAWYSLMPGLAAAGYCAYAIDLPGHGESHKPGHADHYQVGELFRSLEHWMESLPDQQMPYLIGHSLGGHLSLQYSLRHPDLIKALVLIDPFYSQAQLSAGVQWLARRPALGVKALRQVSRKMVHASTYLDAPLRGNFPPEARQQIALDMKRAAPEILHILPSVTDLTPELSSVQTPTLVIYGSRDLTLRPSSFPRLADEMANASLVKVPGVGHLPHLARPQAVNQAILDFLAKYPQ